MHLHLGLARSTHESTSPASSDDNSIVSGFNSASVHNRLSYCDSPALDLWYVNVYWRISIHVLIWNCKPNVFVSFPPIWNNISIYFFKMGHTSRYLMVASLRRYHVTLSWHNLVWIWTKIRGQFIHLPLPNQHQFTFIYVNGMNVSIPVVGLLHFQLGSLVILTKPLMQVLIYSHIWELR